MKNQIKSARALVALCALLLALSACTQSISTVLRGDNTGVVSVITATLMDAECQSAYDFLKQTIVDNAENAQNLRNEGITVLNYNRSGLRGYQLDATFQTPQEVDRKVSAILRLGQGSPGVGDDFTMDILPVSETPQETRWQVNAQITTNSMINPDQSAKCNSHALAFRLRMPSAITQVTGPEPRHLDDFTVEWTLNTADTFRLGATAVRTKAEPTPTPTATPQPTETATPAPTFAPTATPEASTPTPTFAPPVVPTPGPNGGGNLARILAIPLGGIGAIVAIVAGIYLVMYFRRPPAPV